MVEGPSIKTTSMNISILNNDHLVPFQDFKDFPIFRDLVNNSFGEWGSTSLNMSTKKHSVSNNEFFKLITHCSQAFEIHVGYPLWEKSSLPVNKLNK